MCRFYFLRAWRLIVLSSLEQSRGVHFSMKKPKQEANLVFALTDKRRYDTSHKHCTQKEKFIVNVLRLSTDAESIDDHKCGRRIGAQVLSFKPQDRLRRPQQPAPLCLFGKYSFPELALVNNPVLVGSEVLRYTMAGRRTLGSSSVSILGCMGS